MLAVRPNAGLVSVIEGYGMTSRKIAIVGMAEFSEQIPDDHEIWIIALYIGHFTKCHRAFECHEQINEGSGVLKMFIADPWVEFYVPEHLAHIYPTAEPIQTELLGSRYFPTFGSTISYMLAQAVYEKVDEIALYGVGMCDEYEGQRPSAFYWLGVANGLGIKTSGLMTEQTYGLKEKEE